MEKKNELNNQNTLSMQSVIRAAQDAFGCLDKETFLNCMSDFLHNLAIEEMLLAKENEQEMQFDNNI